LRGFPKRCDILAELFDSDNLGSHNNQNK